MDSMLETSSSPRRGSQSSLNKHSSGSSSHETSKSNSCLPSINGMSSTHKEIDKFTRYFIIKTVQAIVQSRVTTHQVKTECKPSGNDWFNINIVDVPEISDKTKSAIDFEGFSIKSNWRVCCEISLRSTDGGQVILEHWIISNVAIPSNLSKNSPNNQQSSPRNYLSNKTSPLSSSNNGPPSSSNPPSGRVRPATFTNTLRKRLNSIDDCSTEDDRENLDIKTSTSCFTLSSPSANHTDDVARHAIATSPSINFLSVNTHSQTSSIANNSSSPRTRSKTSTSLSSSSLSTIYNRMSLLLKTIMTTTHIVPAFRLASETTSANSCEISYRIYASSSASPTQTPPSSTYQNPKLVPGPARGSHDDVSFTPDSPNKRSSSSNSSLGSINIREYVGPDELDSFCPMLKMGSVKTEINELSALLCYRSDVRNTYQLVKSSRAKDMHDTVSGHDCVTAAKQLLAGNEHKSLKKSHSDKKDHASTETLSKSGALDYLDKPLDPPFALHEFKPDPNDQDPNLVLMDSVFENLLKIKREQPNQSSSSINRDEPIKNGHSSTLDDQSEPIQVPPSMTPQRHKDIHNLSSESPKSLTDSFVFVELNPPFASEEQMDLNSFFNGPSPSFSLGCDLLKDVDDMTNQLATIEADACQIDEFIENICLTEGEEDDER